MLFLLATIACDTEPAGDTGTIAEDTGLDCDVIAYTDADGDGWGDLDSATIVCELAGDQVTQGGDCDDTNADATPEKAWYLDADGDGHGDPDTQLASCEAQDGLVDNSGDCDDLDASTSPDGTEVCDGVDNDCNGTVDDGATDALTFYADADGDGYGSDATATACDAPSGHIEVGGDCDDADPWVNPDADEVCDSIDNDCDGAVDFDGWIPTDYSTVAEALDAVPDGAHFCIDEGTHDVADLSYEGWLTLEGVGKDVVTLDANEAHFIEIEGDFSLSGAHLTNITSTESSSYPGINQLEGAVTLKDLEVSDLESPSETGTGYALLAYCYNPCALDVQGVEIHDVSWDNASAQYQSAGSLINAWGGPITIDDLTVRDVWGEGYAWQAMISTWGIGDASATNIEIYDVEARVTNDYGYSYGYIWGPLDLDNAGPVLIEDVSIHDMSIELDDADWGSGSAYAPFFGGPSSDTMELEIRRVETTDNTLIASGTGPTRVQGGVMYLGWGHAELSNWIVGRNVVEGVDQVYGFLFYGDAGTLTNIDVVDNFVSSYTSYGMIVSHGDTLRATNLNVVGNTMEAEVADYGRLVTMTSDEDVTWENANVYDNELDGEADVRGWSDSTEQGGSDLSVDPLYTDQAGGDYTLSAGSPVIDAGSADILDADGSTSDIGAHGGPNAW